MLLENIKEDLEKYLDKLFEIVSLEKEDIFVLGCRTSEILGESIGKKSSLEIGEIIVNTLKERLDKCGVYLAVQCCEHLNRSIVIEKEAVKLYNLEMVNVIPSLKAGGGAATAAYSIFQNPVVVEFISAKAGMDIGDTEIGMHVKYVQVPVRTGLRNIGSAHTTSLTSRLKLIGGERAIYK